MRLTVSLLSRGDWSTTDHTVKRGRSIKKTLVILVITKIFLVILIGYKKICKNY